MPIEVYLLRNLELMHHHLVSYGVYFDEVQAIG
jgi:hypothetical protein